MRTRIEFTNEIDNFIIKLYNQGLTQSEIVNQLKETYDFNISDKTLYRRYKVLNLNGNLKLQRNGLDAWYPDMFTNDEFPSKLANCIISDLCDHNTLDSIAKKHNTSVDTLIGIFNPNDLTKELKNRFRAYLYIYKYDDRTHLSNLDQEQLDNAVSYLNSKLQQNNINAHVVKNYTKEICDKKITFELYCPECDLYITTPGTYFTIIPNIFKLGYNSVQFDDFEIDSDLNIKVLDFTGIMDTIYNKIYNDVNGIVPEKKRRRIVLTEEEEVALENIEYSKVLEENSAENLTDTIWNHLVKYYDIKDKK